MWSLQYIGIRPGERETHMLLTPPQRSLPRSGAEPIALSLLRLDELARRTRPATSCRQ
jgi:hypothetical protein